MFNIGVAPEEIKSYFIVNKHDIRDNFSLIASDEAERSGKEIAVYVMVNDNNMPMFLVAIDTEIVLEKEVDNLDEAEDILRDIYSEYFEEYDEPNLDDKNEEILDEIAARDIELEDAVCDLLAILTDTTFDDVRDNTDHDFLGQVLIDLERLLYEKYTIQSYHPHILEDKEGNRILYNTIVGEDIEACLI